MIRRTITTKPRARRIRPPIRRDTFDLVRRFWAFVDRRDLGL